MKWPLVSRAAYELALAQLKSLQERNDRLTEAISRAKGTAEVLMPQPGPVTLEFSPGWFDNKGVVKETKHAS